MKKKQNFKNNIYLLVTCVSVFVITLFFSWQVINVFKHNEQSNVSAKVKYIYDAANSSYVEKINATELQKDIKEYVTKYEKYVNQK